MRTTKIEWTDKTWNPIMGCPKAHPMRLEWVVNIKRQVEFQGAAFFFKQWGTWGSDGVKRNKHANGKLLLGKVIQQMPEKMAV